MWHISKRISLKFTNESINLQKTSPLSSFKSIFDILFSTSVFLVSSCVVVSFFVVFVLLLSTCAHAGLKEGQAAYAKKDYETAFKEFLALAQAGNSHMQDQIGYMYGVGKGVSKNAKQSFEWHSKAANQGYANAQYNLGNMYLIGEGISKDKKIKCHCSF